MKVILAGGGTGGHLMPALALADTLRELRPDIAPVIVGARRGVEARWLPERRPAYPYHLLPVEPIYRRQWWRNARWVVALPRLALACRRVLDAEQPAFVVGTGGYAAGPVLHFASRRGIPIALQEQNAYPGLTTRLLGKRAHQVHLGFEETRERLRVGADTEVYCYGNPISAPAGIDRDRASARAALGLPDGVGVCFVMGGSQGSVAMNRVLSDALEGGELSGVAVLWSTGAASFDQFSRHHAPPMRQVRPFWDPVVEAYLATDLVVARAGAMTLAELMAFGLPSVLIPLPTAAADHQTLNAVALEQAGCAVHLPQSALTPASLCGAILPLLHDRSRLTAMSEAAAARGKPQAARQVVERLLTLLDGESIS